MNGCFKKLETKSLKKILIHKRLCARFPEILQNFSECQILWSLCSVVFHALTLKLPIQTSLSVAPKLQVCVRSGEKCQKFWKTSTLSRILFVIANLLSVVNTKCTGQQGGKYNSVLHRPLLPSPKPKLNTVRQQEKSENSLLRLTCWKTVIKPITNICTNANPSLIIHLM